MLEICSAAQHLKTWRGAQPSNVHSKAMINYFRALEGRNTTASCPFMPKLLSIEPLDNEIYLPKWVPAIMSFVHCEVSGGVSWVLHLSIVIA